MKLTTALRLGSMPRVAIAGGKTTALAVNFDQLVAELNEPPVPDERSTPQQASFW